MNLAESEMLPTAQRMTLAYLGGAERAKLAPAFALDFRLARIVGTTSEPILAQIRIAWWRDMLAQPIAKRPQGDAVLTALSRHWCGEEDVIIGLVDAWEELLLAECLGEDNALAIAKGRCEFIARAIESSDGQTDKQTAMSFGLRWALADMAAHCSSDQERALLIALAGNLTPGRVSLPRNLRGISVLDALARHSLKRGGRPLAEGRGGALIALRAGLIGR